MATVDCDSSHFDGAILVANQLGTNDSEYHHFSDSHKFDEL